MAFVNVGNRVITRNNNHNNHVNLKTNIKKPIFSNNTVVYKPHSLSSGGVGTVRNQRHKFKNT